MKFLDLFFKYMIVGILFVGVMANICPPGSRQYQSMTIAMIFWPTMLVAFLITTEECKK